MRGREQEVIIAPGTGAGKAYGRSRAVETFLCSFGLNEGLRDAILTQGLEATGEDGDGNVRIIELSGHRFFMATLFVPQLSSQPGAPHPLIEAFVGAAAGFRKVREPGA